MIDRVFVINLERHIERWWFMLGSLHSLDFPLDRVHRIDAIDGKHFEHVEDVNDAAAEDGFEYFRNPDYQVDKYEVTPPNRYMVAANWSYAKAWREITNQRGHCMLLIDDHQPIQGWDFTRFEKLLVAIEWEGNHNNRGEFRLLQLNPQPLPYINYNRRPYDSVLRYGLGGIGDFGLIISKRGAELLLELHPKYGITSNCLDAMIKNGDESGCWHTADILVNQAYLHFHSSRWGD